MAVRVRALRGLIALVVIAAGAAACTRAPSRERRFLDDAAFRRATLVSSLAEPSTAYAKLRVEQYAKWSTLPEDAGGLAITTAARGAEPAALRALGREAFFRYPLQRAPAVGDPSRYGLVHLTGGRLTCATCHTRGAIEGAPNDRLDLGAALAEAHPNAPPDAHAIALAWGPGRVDVSSATGTEPARIPDLRPVRHLTHLQWSGAVRRRDALDLALRIETLIVTTKNDGTRPPPVVALAIATWLEGLADALPELPEEGRGVDVLSRECGGCHEGPGLSGEPVDVDEIGTDPTLARSSDRGTGAYRVPSLRGVGTRGPLLHDGSVPSLDALLDPHRAGGHRYGLDLSPDDRDALLAVLRAL